VRADAVRRLACEHVQAQIKHLEAFVTAARARGILERGEAGEFLDEVRTRAPKLCESRTRDEARGHLRELEAKWKKAKALARARLAREHSDGIRGLEMRMRQLAHRIRVALAHIEARGVDVSPVESKLAECKVSLDAARDKAKEAKDLLGTVESPEQKESVVEQVHGLLADARGKVKEAHACYGDALRLLKEKAREAAGKPTVEPVVTPTPEPEAAPTATPTAEPTAEATPSPSPSP
jgi:chromosome segregation ATPase